MIINYLKYNYVRRVIIEADIQERIGAPEVDKFSMGRFMKICCKPAGWKITIFFPEYRS